jgi:hypothetical protein
MCPSKQATMPLRRLVKEHALVVPSQIPIGKACPLAPELFLPASD